MNIDSFIIKGDHYKYCDDYVISDFIGTKCMGIISDGCGDTRLQYTDIGSRILTMATKKILKDYDFETIVKQNSENESNGYDNINGYFIIPPYLQDILNTANKVREEMALSLDSLQATLIYFILDYKNENETKVEIIMYGDGVIAWQKKKSNIIEVNSIEFLENMPFYPSIYLNPEHLNDFNQYYSNRRAKTLYTYMSPIDFKYEEGEKLEPTEINNYHHSQPIRYSLNLNDLELLMIASDGITALQNQETDLIEPEFAIIQKIFDFKNYSGNFLQRKMQNIITKNYKPLDDLSIVVLENH